MGQRLSQAHLLEDGGDSFLTSDRSEPVDQSMMFCIQAFPDQPFSQFFER